LPVDYRGLPRPSSAPGAKASTVCHIHLATTDNKMLAHTIHKSKNTPHTPLPHTPKHSPHRPTRKSMSYRRWHAGTNHTGCPLRHPTAHPPTPTKRGPRAVGPTLAQPPPGQPQPHRPTAPGPRMGPAGDTRRSVNATLERR